MQLGIVLPSLKTTSQIECEGNNAFRRWFRQS
jgi:hypothetical protein